MELQNTELARDAGRRTDCSSLQKSVEAWPTADDAQQGKGGGMLLFSAELVGTLGRAGAVYGLSTQDFYFFLHKSLVPSCHWSVKLLLYD